MLRVEESIHIDRPISEVFGFATDPDNQTLFASNLVAYDLDGPMEKGAQPRGTTRVAGRKIDWTAEITEFKQDERVELRSMEAPMDFNLSWTYEPDGEGTKVTFAQEVENIGGFFGRLSDPLVLKMYARDVRSNLEKLKVLLEEG